MHGRTRFAGGVRRLGEGEHVAEEEGVLYQDTLVDSELDVMRD